MSQLHLVASQNSNENLRTSQLDSVKCRMSRAGSPKSPLERKAAVLQDQRPDLAAVIEVLVDDLLADLA